MSVRITANVLGSTIIVATTSTAMANPIIRIIGGNPSRYITKKNKKNNPERLELKKFNPIMKKVTVHKEIK